MDIVEIRWLFSYDEWANARLLRSVGELTVEQLTRNLASSYGSIRDTFSHIVAVEWVWLRRWRGDSPSSLPAWAVTPDPESLRKKLDEVEQERATFLASLSPRDLMQPIGYRNLKGERWEYPLQDQLLHLVNHSTYHRGQIAAMLRQVGATPPPTDLLVFKDETWR